ncbi:MAG: hypothetical protein FWH12_06970, partial [Treponema sp.]|nr:hypothetical protein [Treponema sp.]
MNRICSFLFLLLLPLLFLGCSSSPRRQGDSRVIRNLAANQINLANQSMLQGRYEEALFILDEARRLALSVDDPALRVQVAISQGSVHFAMGQEARAFQEWRDAVLLAETWGLSDLAAHARIIEIQGELFLLDQRGGDNYHQAEEL